MSSAIVPTYARVDLTFERGDGAWLTTVEGERYLDFGAGIAVVSLGHSHPHLVETLTRLGAAFFVGAFFFGADFLTDTFFLAAMALSFPSRGGLGGNEITPVSPHPIGDRSIPPDRNRRHALPSGCPHHPAIAR